MTVSLASLTWCASAGRPAPACSTTGPCLYAGGADLSACHGRIACLHQSLPVRHLLASLMSIESSDTSLAPPTLTAHAVSILMGRLPMSQTLGSMRGACHCREYEDTTDGQQATLLSGPRQSSQGASDTAARHSFFRARQLQPVQTF